MELNAEAIAAFVREAAGADTVHVVRIERLTGGAIQENWRVQLEVKGGSDVGSYDLVLRTDAASRVPLSLDRPQEFAVLRAACRAGVTVPKPLWLCADDGPIGRPFYLMQYCLGEARGQRLVRDPAVLAIGDSLAERLGRELAKIHRLRPPIAGLDFLPVPQGHPALARVAEYRRCLDGLDAAEPVLEWALRWLERHAPPPFDLTLVHGDFRTGNYLVDEGQLSAVLDWEFAGFGDPLEDLGWLLAKCWRFGAWDRECGGVGSRDALCRGYEAEAGRRLPRQHLPYWEVLATVRWAVIALLQAQRHRSGEEPSVELALTAHVVPSLELDLLNRIDEITTELVA